MTGIEQKINNARQNWGKPPEMSIKTQSLHKYIHQAINRCLDFLAEIFYSKKIEQTITKDVTGCNKLTTMSLPSFSGRFAILIAAAAAAPEDIPTCREREINNVH